jgi:hypothetical protein
MATRRKPIRKREGGAVSVDMPTPVPPGAGEGEAPAVATVDNPRQSAPTLEERGPVADALEQIKRAEQLQQRMAQPPSMDAQIAVLPQEAQAWLRAHPEYWTDQQKNRKLHGLHGYLTDTKGLRPFSTEYFDRLETELGLRREPIEPVVEKPAPIAPAPPRSVPYAAPVTRGAPSVGGGSIAQKIVLSPEEVQMAHMSYRDLPPEKAERLYAEMKRRMVLAKAAGEIQS